MSLRRGFKMVHRKSKVVSILLAVFLTYFTWLYTYKRNGWKFWLGLVVSSFPVLVAAIFLVFYISPVSWLPGEVLIFLCYALPMIVWAWAIIDCIVQKRDWYDNYYQRQIAGKLGEPGTLPDAKDII
jgi:hypothetical protein